MPLLGMNMKVCMQGPAFTSGGRGKDPFALSLHVLG